jgi:hypothetical protein
MVTTFRKKIVSSQNFQEETRVMLTTFRKKIVSRWKFFLFFSTNFFLLFFVKKFIFLGWEGAMHCAYSSFRHGGDGAHLFTCYHLFSTYSIHFLHCRWVRPNGSVRVCDTPRTATLAHTLAGAQGLHTYSEIGLYTLSIVG